MGSIYFNKEELKFLNFLKIKFPFTKYELYQAWRKTFNKTSNIVYANKAYQKLKIYASEKRNGVGMILLLKK